VHGIKRRSSLINTDRIDHLYQDPHVDSASFILHYGDLSDSTNIIRIIQEVQPDEIYNLGAMSHVKVSFDEPEYTAQVDGIGTLRILEAIRLLGLIKKKDQSVPSVHFGTLRPSTGSSAIGDDSLLPPFSLRRC
jgi:GDPmannose 4,6-dehydratase